MSPGNLWIVLFVFVNVALGLQIEALGASRGITWLENAVGFVTSLHLLFYFMKPPVLSNGPVRRTTLIVCLILATLGELVLSAVFGLYTYRSSLLPFFVPPGHVLLFLAGLIVSDQRWCGGWLIWLVGSFGASALLYFALQGRDLLSVPLFLLFVACLLWGTEKRLYAVMFALALCLEICGTWYGAWRWHPELPWFRISVANPPLAAGAFYACLDLLTVFLTVHLRGRLAWQASQTSRSS